MLKLKCAVKVCIKDFLRFSCWHSRFGTWFWSDIGKKAGWEGFCKRNSSLIIVKMGGGEWEKPQFVCPVVEIQKFLEPSSVSSSVRRSHGSLSLVRCRLGCYSWRTKANVSSTFFIVIPTYFLTHWRRRDVWQAKRAGNSHLNLRKSSQTSEFTHKIYAQIKLQKISI